MDAILFDKDKSRHEVEISDMTEQIILDRESKGVLYSVKYSYSLQDSKGRPVYVETNRELKQTKKEK